jgi:hypothetical protein
VGDRVRLSIPLEVYSAAHYPGRERFPVDVPPGEPSKWLTFFAMRALRRWDELRA